MSIDSLRRSGDYESARTRVGQATAAAALERLEDRALLSTYTVNTLADAIAPSATAMTLRQAIARAAAHAGPDTIAFATSLTGTIKLTAGPLVISDAGLTISGPGAGRLSISGDNASRVFQVESGSTLKLSGLTITAGNADTGAGLASTDASVTVSNCVFQRNVATGATGSGGAIYARGGSLTVSGTKFLANAADARGGAIHAGDLSDPAPTIVRLTRCTFDANTASEGAGVSSYSFSTPDLPTLTVAHCTFRGNDAAQFGGAVSGGGNITTSTFTDNTAGFGGGAVWQHQAAGDLSMTDSTFTSNESGGAGGALGQPFDANASTVARCTFRGNKAGSGGAISFLFSTPPRISGSTFDANQAAFTGGAIVANQISRMQIENTTFTNNAAGAFGGGAIVLLRSTGDTLKNVSFVGNQTTGGNGGAILASANSSFTVADSLFKNNTAAGLDGVPSNADGGSAQGGAIALDPEAGLASITGTTFTGNVARGGDAAPGGAGGNASGGAIADNGFDGIALANSTLKNNLALGGRGGDASPTADAGRGGDASGGALFGTPTADARSLAGTTVFCNVALGGDGGDATGAAIAGDGGDARGGGLFLDPTDGPESLAASTLKANRALGGDGGDGATRGNGGHGQGGALFLPATPTDAPAGYFAISTSTLTANLAKGGQGATAGLGQGGGVYNAGEAILLDPLTTLKRNHASTGPDDLFGDVLISP